MLKKQLKYLNKFIEKNSEKVLALTMIFFIANLCFPHISVAKTIEPYPQLPLLAGKLEFLTAEELPLLIPESQLPEPLYNFKIWVTAYNSHVSQTDASPCITASGFNLCEYNQEDVIATNFLYLPFGTKVRFPELFGNKVFTIQDRMNVRYNRTADIWMRDFLAAKRFGRKYTTIEIMPFVR